MLIKVKAITISSMKVLNAFHSSNRPSDTYRQRGGSLGSVQVIQDRLLIAVLSIQIELDIDADDKV